MATIVSEPRAVDPATLHNVRREVRHILENTPAYWELPHGTRQEMANAMVRVGTYLVDGERPGSGSQTGARQLAEDDESPRQPPADQPFDPGTAKDDFGDVASRAGTDAFAAEVKAVNFPQFVADLIHGTFDAIVTASIKQMDAYSELLKNVTKSLDEYMRDNVTENNARDYLAGKYPDALSVDTSGGAPKLAPAAGASSMQLPDFMKDLGLPQPVDTLDQDTIDQTLVPAARQRMALDRQHLLATMVLMGINRLVVTDGDINAKVLFQLDSVDKAVRGGSQTQNFSDTETRNKSKFGWWFSPSTSSEETTNFTVATTKTASSQAEVDLHTKLSGEVNVRFKTDAFPLDKMADIIGVDKIGNEQVGTGKNLQSQPSGNREPAPPLPLPPMPSVSIPGVAQPTPPAGR